MIDFLRAINVVPDYATWNEIFNYYPLFDKRAIKGEHLASLAIEWDEDGPVRAEEWVSMISINCGNTKRHQIAGHAI